MKAVSVTALRRNLAAHLARVGRGERIDVTSRGRVIARLVPPARLSRDIAAARLRLRGSVLRYDRPLEPVLDSPRRKVKRSAR